MGAEDQAERWTADDGGWFPGKTSSAKKGVNKIFPGNKQNSFSLPFA